LHGGHNKLAGRNNLAVIRGENIIDEPEPTVEAFILLLVREVEHHFGCPRFRTKDPRRPEGGSWRDETGATSRAVGLRWKGFASFARPNKCVISVHERAGRRELDVRGGDVGGTDAGQRGVVEGSVLVQQ